MKRVLTAVAMFFAMIGTASAQSVPSRSATIQAASNLSYVASQISNYAYSRGFSNTYAYIFQVSKAAGRIEYAARYQSVADAQMAANEAVRNYIEARPHIAQIWSLGEQNYIRSNVRSALNQVLFALGESVPVSYAAACVSTDNCSAGGDDNVNQIMSIGGAWAEDGGASNPSSPSGNPNPGFPGRRPTPGFPSGGHSNPTLPGPGGWGR